MNYLIYLAFLGVSLFLSFLYENKKKYNRPSRYVYIYLLWLVVFIFGAIRFDVGNDYFGYVRNFQYIANGNFLSHDYFIVSFLITVFKLEESGYPIIFGFYYFITISILLLVLVRFNVVFWGVFIFICFGVMFDTFDRIRQMAAFAFFVYSIKDIGQKKLLKYLFKLSIASCFHISAIVLIPLYWLARFKINNLFKFTIIIFLIILYFTGINQKLFYFFYNVVPLYSKYADTKYMYQSVALGSGLGFLSRVFILTVLAMYPLPSSRTYLQTLLFFGIILYLIGVGNLNITRISDYLIGLTILIFPIFVHHARHLSNKLLLVLPMVILFLGLYTKSLDKEYFIYQTVFGDAYKNQHFKIRLYRDEN